jgi:magnesium chelatase family protein
VVAVRVMSARAPAAARGVAANSRLSVAQLADVTSLDPGAVSMLERALDSGRLSGRGLFRVRLVALTLDDLRGGDGQLDRDLIAQALTLRTEIDLRSHLRASA